MAKRLTKKAELRTAAKRGDVDQEERDRKLFPDQTTRISVSNLYGLFHKTNVSVEVFYSTGESEIFPIADSLPTNSGANSTKTIDISNLNKLVVKAEWRFKRSVLDQFIITRKAPEDHYLKVIDAWWGKLGEFGENDEFHFFVSDTPLP